ncbi:hypothetical protein JJB07_11650 [Tumebacillus sp. ITR2]|uniref:Lipoprotein n=1 Tax=Tumebacillus amylolyticus TaxID=2801339 RepID=A0ABS1JAJ3_9BACL|nr:hypothetical protein [Tumebacillus amylolyticus]MBL0387306.1 hypothetical protein [Tumebacillus amylolyticus]
MFKTKRVYWLHVAAAAGLALMLTGCSQQTAQPTPTKQVPTPTQPNVPKESGTSSETPTPTPSVDKTDDEIQVEIKEKLNRLTHTQGYILPTDSSQQVVGATTLAEVSELLRKKGYSSDLAHKLTASFYQEQGSAVTIIAKDGYVGAFDPALDAVLARKNKYSWTVTQKHPDDALYGPHTATYEVEVLKDGSYRLNSWSVSSL